VRALKNATAKQLPRALLRGQKRGRVGRDKKPLPQRVKEWNDAVANDCKIVTYYPRGGILRFNP